MISREGEAVDFIKEQSISEDPAIYKWLTKVQDQMQFTIATLLDTALKALWIIDRNED